MVVVKEEEDCEKEWLLCSGMMMAKMTIEDAIVTPLRCLREWDSLCCSFGTGLSDFEEDPRFFHHLSRALK